MCARYGNDVDEGMKGFANSFKNIADRPSEIKEALRLFDGSLSRYLADKTRYASVA